MSELYTPQGGVITIFMRKLLPPDPPPPSQRKRFMYTCHQNWCGPPTLENRVSYLTGIYAYLGKTVVEELESKATDHTGVLKVY